MKKLVIVIITLTYSFLIGAGFVYGQQTQPRISPDPQPTLAAPISTPAPLLYGLPKTLEIPKIEVQAQVESVGLDKSGRMDVPKEADNVAWFNLGVKPGELGNAVLAGHLDRINSKPAVFWNLKKLEVGDEIKIFDDQGKQLTFKVTKKAVYNLDQFPLQEVFGSSDVARLNLITCEGTYNKEAKNYSQRTVIYSELQP